MQLTSDMSNLLRLHRAIFVAREIDRVEKQLVKQGLAHFHVSGAGHEATAMLADYVGPQDWLHLHYRDKALMLARGMTVADFFGSLLATASSHSAGRQMSAHLSAPALKITSLVGPVGNNALHAVGVAAAVKDLPDTPIVVCCLGDGTTQQGEVLEALAEAVRTQSPVLFVVENNGYSISTITSGRTFFDLPSGPAASFFGLDIIRADGSDLKATRAAFERGVTETRRSRGPGIVVLDLERLSDHTNADSQTVYRPAEEIAAGLSRDPLEAVRRALEQSQMGKEALAQVELLLAAEVAAAASKTHEEFPPKAEPQAKAPYPLGFAQTAEYRGEAANASLTMREAINGVLRQHLAADAGVFLYGQDIEDPKGDVFGVTRGLSTSFPDRVRNAPLSESTIVGTAIGRALAGQRPVAFLQFADFLPLAGNQIMSELGSMHWRSNGGWQAPVIVMASCGGYKAGLGPFHAQTLEAMLAHTPGIDVVMPSSAGDAAGLLNAAFASGRPTVFLYPKGCLNTADRATSADLECHFVAPGSARYLSRGRDVTLVTYGNPVAQSLQAVEALVAHGFSADLIDLRSISPWDEREVLASVRRTGKLVVVHEDNLTAGFGAEVLATVMEKAGVPVAARRVTRPDTYVPFQFDNQLEILPSFRRVLEACAALLDCDVEWEVRDARGDRALPVAAIGSGPADDNVLVTAVLVKPGDHVAMGQTLATVEATKAAVEVCTTFAGTVRGVLVTVGETIAVGKPLLLLDPDDPTLMQPAAAPAENAGTARVTRRHAATAAGPSYHAGRSQPLAIHGIAGISGSRRVSNKDLIGNWPTRGVADISALTGIESRQWVGPGEGVLSLATAATRELFARLGTDIAAVDLVIAATGTPDIITPSLACRVAAALAGEGNRPVLPAYDINAACSGYLFALRQAHDFIAQSPAARVLIITAEVLSPLLDLESFTTAILFGDGATATLVAGAGQGGRCEFVINRPVVSGRPESGALLRLPKTGDGHLVMEGRAVFTEAVRSMEHCLEDACVEAGIAMNELDILVPHQANQRIIDAMARRAGRPAFSNIAELGNTSSSSIPLALLAMPKAERSRSLGLVAFGGGMTFAAAIGRTSDAG